MKGDLGCIKFIAEYLGQDPGLVSAPEVEVTEDDLAVLEPGKILLEEHMGEAELERVRREIGNAAFLAQYQQAPSLAGGNIIRPEWFGTIPAQVKRQHYEAILQRWETASIPGESNDYSVCTTCGLLGTYVDLLQVHLQQYLYPELVETAIDLSKAWKSNVIANEKAVSGLALKPSLVRNGVPQANWLEVEKGKVHRMIEQSTKLDEASSTARSRAMERGLRRRGGGFPNGKYDDQADSMSQALRALDLRRYELLHCSRFKG